MCGMLVDGLMIGIDGGLFVGDYDEVNGMIGLLCDIRVYWGLFLVSEMF